MTHLVSASDEKRGFERVGGAFYHQAKIARRFRLRHHIRKLELQVVDRIHNGVEVGYVYPRNIQNAQVIIAESIAKPPTHLKESVVSCGVAAVIAHHQPFQCQATRQDISAYCYDTCAIRAVLIRKAIFLRRLLVHDHDLEKAHFNADYIPQLIKSIFRPRFVEKRHGRIDIGKPIKERMLKIILKRFVGFLLYYIRKFFYELVNFMSDSILDRVKARNVDHHCSVLRFLSSQRPDSTPQ